MSNPMEYGSGQYGAGVYGGTPLSTRSQAGSVGTQFDIMLNGVGLKLLPEKKAYDKHAAQTFSYNPKSLFKQGDGAALNPRDLYYWTRLEHSKWDGGETYEPWTPDATDLGRLDHKYATSNGFDVIDPHQLSHLRSVLTSPSYEFVVSSDTPLVHWPLYDPASSTQVIDLVSNNRTPGDVFGPVQFVTIPGPIYGEPSQAAAFDGTSAYILSHIDAPFSGGDTTPLTEWALEAWALVRGYPQTNATIAFCGEEPTINGATYVSTITADTPFGWWRLGDANAPADDQPNHLLDNTVQTNHLNYDGGPSFEDFDGQQPGLISGDADKALKRLTSTGIAAYGGGVGGPVVTGPGTGSPADDVSPSGSYPFTDNFSMEAWVYPTQTQQGLVMVNWGGGPNPPLTKVWGMYIGASGWGGGLGLNVQALVGTHATVDSGYALPAINATYHIVITYTGGKFHFFVNGVEVGTPQSFSPLINDEREGFSIGGRAIADADNFVGTMDEIAVYNYVLTGAQILSHYTVGSSGGGGSVGGGGFGFCIGAAGGGSGSKLIGRLPASGHDFWDTGYTFTDGVWHHIVMTSHLGTIDVYVDNVKTPNSQATNAAHDLPHLSVGADGVLAGAKNFAFITAAQTVLYDHRLTTTQIQNHYRRGTGHTSYHLLQSGGLVGTYYNFVDDFSGTLYINQKNTNMLYSLDGGASWTATAMPEADTTDFKAVWTDGKNVYAATANNIYSGSNAGFAELNNANPDIAGVTAGLFYSGQIYVGIGTSLYYVDPATGLTTQLFDTKYFTINWIQAFGGKIWFGGFNNRMSRLWTWTNNTLPPSPANGVGAQVQDGTIPYGVIVHCATVYLNTLLLGATIAGDTATEGQGAVYYVTSTGQFGQLCLLGPLLSQIRGTGIDYGVRSLWGAENMIWMGYSYNTGMARYDFTRGAFSSHVTIPDEQAAVPESVLAVARFNGKSVFATGINGDIWKEGSDYVPVAVLTETEFQELPFLPKTIDGIEGQHAPLNVGESVSVEISFDHGSSWTSLGTNSEVGSDHFDFPQIGVAGNHWRSRIRSIRSAITSLAPVIKNWSVRFAPQNSPKHEWVANCYLPTIQRSSMGAILTDAGSKLLGQLWASREVGTAVDFVDRDGKQYKVLVIEIHESEINYRSVRGSAQQLQQGAIMQIELLELQKVTA